MKSIVLDFAPRGWRHTLYQTGPRTWLCLVAGFTLCVLAAFSASRLRDEIAAQQVSLDRINLKLNERAHNKPVAKKITITESQAVAVNGAVAQLNLPWRDMFDAVEGATPASVALLALEPDAKRNLLRGVAEAKTSDDMITYIEQLKKQTFFTTVLLTKHEINEQDPNKPLRFQFEAQWTEGAP